MIGKICLILLLITGSIFAQVGIETEKDTTYLIETRTLLRDILNDRDTTSGNYRWSNKSLDRFINSAMIDVAGAGLIIKKDIIIVSPNLTVATLATDCKQVNGILVRSVGRLKAMQYNSPETKSQQVKPFGRGTDQNSMTNFYDCEHMLYLDPPSTKAETLLVFYQAYSNDVLDTAGSGKHTVDSIIVNVPFECQGLVVLKAAKKALMSNRELQTLQFLLPDINAEIGSIQSQLKMPEPEPIPGVR